MCILKLMTSMVSSVLSFFKKITDCVKCSLCDSSPDLRETLVSCFGHSTFLEHVVTHIAEDLKLFFAGESVSTVATFHNAEHLTLDQVIISW